MNKPIYEYLLKDGKVIKLTHTKIEERMPNCYSFHGGLSKSWKYIRKADFDRIIKNHIYSFEDNLEKFTLEFMLHYAGLVADTKRQFENYKSIYEKLEQEVFK